MLTHTDAYFLTIARTGNLNQAAQQLYVSQPSLSKYIQRLETSLGTPLFDRTCSPMRLNEAGQLYLSYLQDAMERERQLMERIGEIRREVRGTLRVGIPSFCGQCYLPKVLPVFKREYPNVCVELTEETGEALEKALLGHRIDLAVLHSPIVSPGLSCRSLMKERILLAAERRPEDGRAASGGRFSIREGRLEDFMGKPAIMPQDDQKLGMAINDFFSRIHYRPEVVTQSQNVMTRLALAAAGMGVGFVPESGLESVSEEILNRLSFYSMSRYLPDWELVALTRKDTVLSAFALRFLQLFRENAGSGADVIPDAL